jgi:hypothetical protein
MATGPENRVSEGVYGYRLHGRAFVIVFFEHTISPHGYGLAMTFLMIG